MKNLAVLFLVALLVVGMSSAIVAQNPEKAKTEKVVLKIEGQGEMKGMVCDGCKKRVETALLEVKGVTKAEADLKKQEAYVEYEKGKVTIDDLKKAVDETGIFKVSKVRKEKAEK